MIVFPIDPASERIAEPGTMAHLRAGLRRTFVLLLIATPACWADEQAATSPDRSADRAAIVAGIKRLGGWVKPDDKNSSQPVVEVHLSGLRVTDADMPALAGLTELRSLDLMATDVTDAGLARLRPLVNLEELSLGNNRITDQGLSGLAELINLRRLKLTLQVTGQGLVHLKALGRLQQLDLAASRTSDAGLATLEKATDLRELFLDDTDVTDAGLAHLKGLTRLQSLSLTGTHVTDQGLENVQGMVDLRKLHLNKTPVTGSGLRHLAGLAGLEGLYLMGSQATDAGLENLKPFKNLRYLSLRETPITDAGLAHLEGLVRLEQLELIGTRITDAGLVHLEGLADLYYLDVNGTSVTPEGARKLQRALADTQIVDGLGATVGNKVPYNGLALSDITRQKQSPLIERTMPKLTVLMARSEDARRKVAGSLAVEGKPGLLTSPNPSDRGYQEQLRRDLAGRTEAAVRQSRRYAKAVRPAGSSVTFLPASRIVVAEVLFPPVSVSPTRQKGELTIDYWICPDRISALALYWLRSGQINSVRYGRYSEVERAVAAAAPISKEGHDGRFAAPAAAVVVGEAAYWFDPMMTMQLPARSEDEASQANRYSFLRGNVVVEIASPDYILQQNGNRLLWIGNVERNPQEFLDIARAIDQDLVRLDAQRIGPRVK